MTRYWYDTEFLEDGRTIELISIGIVSDDGREYYSVNRDAPWKRIYKHDWLMKNVVSSLPQIHGDPRNHVPVRSNPAALDFDSPLMRPHRQIADEARDFLLAGSEPELWAWYGSYDHVVLCQLWGTMMDLPAGMPMWTNDLQQEVHRLGNPELPTQEAGQHNALADARHLRVMWESVAAAAGLS